MISRWDAAANFLAHTGLDTIPCRVDFHCERCGCREFRILRETIEYTDRVSIARTFILECLDCGLQEVSAVHTVLIGGPKA